MTFSIEPATNDAANDNSYVEHAVWSPSDIARYDATCHGRSDSQVPI